MNPIYALRCILKMFLNGVSILVIVALFAVVICGLEYTVLSEPCNETTKGLVWIICFKNWGIIGLLFLTGLIEVNLPITTTNTTNTYVSSNNHYFKQKDDVAVVV